MAAQLPSQLALGLRTTPRRTSRCHTQGQQHGGALGSGCGPPRPLLRRRPGQERARHPPRHRRRPQRRLALWLPDQPYRLEPKFRWDHDVDYELHSVDRGNSRAHYMRSDRYGPGEAFVPDGSDVCSLGFALTFFSTFLDINNSY